MARFDLIPLLDYINPDADYLTWTQVGMALKHEGYPVTVWEDWSRKGQKYHEGECAKKWDSFNELAGEVVTGATITQMAKANGWKRRSNKPIDPFTYQWSDADLVPMDFDEEDDFRIPTEEVWDPLEDLINYLRTLYKPDEHLEIVTEGITDEKTGRVSPKRNKITHTCDHIVAELKRNNSVISVIGGSLRDDTPGAWININPLDGQGISNANVTDFRYALVESDDMPLARQLSMIKQMKLPCAAIVYSGGKSVHAVVKVNAETVQEYRRRVEKLYEVCNKNGFTVDTQNKNPARLTRLPGVTRNGVPQFLIDTNVGAENWDAWLTYLDEVNDDLPPFESMKELLENMPELAPSCIDGVLRMGHKMIVTGPSKAGKSFLLIQLAIAIASGRTWLKWHCRQGRVLYINLEIDHASLVHRFDDIYKNIDPQIRQEAVDNIVVWNLRGKITPMEKISPVLNRRISEQKYTAVIIDPIYKVLLGDENKAEDISKFGGWLDYIAQNTGAAVIYCHHHSKGSQGMKKAEDRGSGSGVFARDADAIFDMTPIELSEEERDADPDPAFAISTVLREYPSCEDFGLRFRWPIHELDDTLDALKTEGSLEGNRIKGNNTQTANKNTRIEEFREKLERHLKAGDKVTQNSIAEEIGDDGISVKTARRYLKKLNEAAGSEVYKVENGTGRIMWADTLL